MKLLVTHFVIILYCVLFNEENWYFSDKNVFKASGKIYCTHILCNMDCIPSYLCQQISPDSPLSPRPTLLLQPQVMAHIL